MKADTLWQFVRRLHPAGENEKKSAAMDELRANVLELRVVPNEEQAKAGNVEDVDDDEGAVQARLVDHETQLAQDKPVAETENDDPEALLAADTKALGTTTAALRDLDITKSYAPFPPRDTAYSDMIRALFLSPI